MDRGALDAALALNFPCCGYCPKGRRAEDGRIADRYPLIETPEWQYPPRTKLNVQTSTATLILIRGKHLLDKGTLYTSDLCGQFRRPCFVVDILPAYKPKFDEQVFLQLVCKFMENELIGFENYTLNVAGPRESRCVGIQKQAELFVLCCLQYPNI